MKKPLVPIILILLFLEQAFSYQKIQVIAVDSALWNEIRVFEDWTYAHCRGSFVEYPNFVPPTIHYELHFFDERNHEIVLHFSRHKGKISKFSHIIDLTDFSENLIRISKEQQN